MSAAEGEVQPKVEVKEEEEEAQAEEETTEAEAANEGEEAGEGDDANADDGADGDGANGEDEDLLLLDEVGGDDKKEDEGKEEEEGEKSKGKEKQGGTNRLISIHEYQLDRVIDINDRTIFIGPLTLDDLRTDNKLQEYMSKKAKRFYIKYDNNDGDVKGHIELLFKSEEEALVAEKDLQGFKENVTVKQNNEEFKKSQEYKELKFGPADEGTSIKRTLVIKGTPIPITKEELLEKIPDAVHIILPKRGTPPEYPGFAFVEMPTVERADSMVDTKIEFAEKSSATLQKFDHIPSVDVLFRLIDKNGFDRQLTTGPLTPTRFQRLQTLILQCHYYERCAFLVKSQKLESLKRRGEMLVSRRTEHKRLARRYDNRKRPGPYSPHRNAYPPKRPRYNSRGGGGFSDGRGPRDDWNEGPGWGPPPLMDYGGPRGGGYHDDGYWGDDYGYGGFDGYDDFGRSNRGRRMPPGGPMRDRSGPRGGGNRYGGGGGGGGGGNRYGGSSHSGGSGRGGRGKRGSGGYRGKY